MTDSSSVFSLVSSTLGNMILDWGLDTNLTRETRIVADLGFESIDIIQMVVALEKALGRRDLGFDRLLMRDGRYVDDLSLGDVADFLEGRLESQ